ncbi:MAG: YebC/PmpR family DNA-binding transcriptional regulator [Candidatus Spechtbacterales bacterium]
MSGHSKWSTIKHKKAATDQKRADIFSKMARIVTIAARQGGGDLETNYALRGLVDKAKNLNMPKDNIDRAIKKGTGELAGETLEELLMEAYGPGGVALLVEVVTDNRNRASADVRHILNKLGGKLATAGSVQWLFDRKGYASVPMSTIADRDAFELAAIEAGADDIVWNEEQVSVYTAPESIQEAQKALVDEGYEEMETGLDWVAKDAVLIDKAAQSQLEQLFEALNENDDVQEVYTNAG